MANAGEKSGILRCGGVSGYVGEDGSAEGGNAFSG
jgi:hypothetical protein